MAKLPSLSSCRRNLKRKGWHKLLWYTGSQQEAVDFELLQQIIFHLALSSPSFSSHCSTPNLIMLSVLLFTAVLLAVARAGPCDIYKEAQTPCVAAHSTVRALWDSYAGALYQLKRNSDGKTIDIHPLLSGGVADAASHNNFCQTGCVISIIYDQSGKDNHLAAAPAGGAEKSAHKAAVANRQLIKVGGQNAYGVSIDEGVGYRNDKTKDIAKGDEAEAIYMVVKGTRFNNKCCFVYGNADTSNNDEGAATMESLYYGNNPNWARGAGDGPWVMADFEDGLFGCADKYCQKLKSEQSDFVVAMLKGRSGGTFGLKSGDAKSEHLKTLYDGPRPPNYTVMKKQGAIVLGIGGDNSNSGIGAFFEGCIVKGNPSDATDAKVYENIVSARFELYK